MFHHLVTFSLQSASSGFHFKFCYVQSTTVCKIMPLGELWYLVLPFSEGGEAGRCSDGCSPKGQEVSVVAARFGLSFMFVPLGSGKYILLCKRSRGSAQGH